MRVGLQSKVKRQIALQFTVPRGMDGRLRDLQRYLVSVDFFCPSYAVNNVRHYHQK